MEAMGFSLRAEAVLHTLTLDVLKSSEIEGEILDKEQVRSSIARRLGINIGTAAPVSRNIEGVVAFSSPVLLWDTPRSSLTRAAGCFGSKAKEKEGPC